MNEARRRLLEGSQSLYLGLVGMVLAIALELLVSRVHELVAGGLGTGELALLGLQALCLVQALLYLWVAWGMGTALLRVVPGYLDAAAPLTLGIFAFLAVAWVDPVEPFALLWLTGLAFGGVVLPTGRLFARAHAESSNAGVLTGVDGARMQRWNAAVGVASLGAALLGSLTDVGAPAAFAGLVAANLLILGATLEWLGQVRRTAAEG